MTLPKHATSEPSLGELVRDVEKHLATVIHGEIELAKLELKTSARFGGIGIGLFAGAVVVFVFSLTFGFLALAEGLIAAGLPRWAGYFAVFVMFTIVAAVAVFIGIREVKKVRAPQRTIDTTLRTVAALKAAASNTPDVND